MSKNKWEYEQGFKEYILYDAKLCLAYATSETHFVFLMRRLGYEFKRGDYLSVRIPEMKLYHRLDKMDEMFAKENMKYCFGSGKYGYYPHYYTKNTIYLKRANLTPLQKKYYAKMYRLGLIEKRRFSCHSAQYAEEIKRMHRLQDEYLFLCDNHIENIPDLLSVITDKKKEAELVDGRQHAIYRETACRKRKCRTTEDFREYQIWHMGIQKELDELKARKKELKQDIRLGTACIGENTMTALYEVDEQEKLEYGVITDIPERSRWKEWEIAEEFGLGYNGISERRLGNISGTDQVKIKENGYFGEIITDKKTFVETDDVMDEVANNLVMDGSVSEKTDMVDIEQAEQAEISNMHSAVISETLEEKAFRIAVHIAEEYGSFVNLSAKQKAELLEMDVTDLSSCIKLYGLVCKEFGIRLDGMEAYEQSQEIYDEAMELEENVENRDERNVEKRWNRGR